MVNKLPKINCCVSNLLNKNQFLIRVSVRGVEYLVFQSYSSEIAIYNTESQKLYINERYINYSKTTSKHLYYFINTHVPAMGARSPGLFLKIQEKAQEPQSSVRVHRAWGVLKHLHPWGRTHVPRSPQTSGAGDSGPAGRKASVRRPRTRATPATHGGGSGGAAEDQDPEQG